MAASLSQHTTTAQTTATSSSTVTVTATSSGDTAVLWVAFGGGAPGAIGVSGLGATWTQLQHVDNTPTLHVYYQLWVGTGCTAGGTTITVTTGNATRRDIDVQVWAGAPSVIASAISAVTTSGTPLTPSISTTAVGQGVGGFFGQFQGNNLYTGYTDTGDAYTVADSTYDAPDAVQMHSAYTVSTAAQVEQHQANGGPSNEWVSAAVVLGTAPVAPAYRSPHLTVVRQAVSRSSVF